MSGQISVDEMSQAASAVVGARCFLTVQDFVGETYSVTLGRVSTGRRVHRVAVQAERVHPVVMELAAELSVPGPVSGGGGLVGDGWWSHETLATLRAARGWVRLVLLQRPRMTDAECDRFIASLDVPKREDLLRRAVEGRGPAGF